jgi:hypothetical protein
MSQPLESLQALANIPNFRLEFGSNYETILGTFIKQVELRWSLEFVHHSQYDISYKHHSVLNNP